MYQKSTYTIRRKSRELVHTQIISNRFIRDLTEDEVGALVADSATQWFINADRDSLWPLNPAEVSDLWEHKIQGHVAPHEARLDDYPGGYFYWAELWRGHGGSNIVVLKCCH